MAKKLTTRKSGKTLRELYLDSLSRILNDVPLTLDNVTMLCYRFPDSVHCHGYHYDLMNAHIQYLTFDGYADGRAIVVFRQGEPTIQQARDIASRTGGVEFKPNLDATN